MGTSKSKLSRDKQLVRAGHARAAITGYLVAHKGAPITQDHLMPLVKNLEYTSQELGQLLYRMADDKLIAKHPVEHQDYKVGYTCSEVVPEPVIQPRKNPKAAQHRKSGDEIPIDLRANKDGSITLRVSGLRITVSREV